MPLICIKHPHAGIPFDVCSKCLESIPPDARWDVVDAIREEYEIHNRLAERCRTATTAVNV